ncbi:hypothetical protein SCMU_39530 [Sinomonas cyclohexanicum]|uniref:Uncharacterized protein n=1 Tax=Sinomonas cyclohexanicum TaxID=322009 RepID=A0ABN6FMK1_SINCY|nr:hypothetical protein [Corynebacterium cyclohexanicum]BCT78111.1 hypothetical protein SCMU_39530 [Corynebacterium cyclohexanicum]
MGLFSRRKAMDPELEGLTTDQAALLRRLAVEAAARHGVHAQANPDHLETADGQRYGLSNLARTVASEPGHAWEAAVDRHFTAVLSGTPAAALEGPELLGRLRAKFIAPETVTQDRAERDFGYVRWVAYLPLVIAVDHPEKVAYLTDADLARLGDPEQVWHTASMNLLSAGLGGTPEEVAHEGGAFLGLQTGSVYTATWMAYPQALMQALGFTPGPLGAFLAAPAANALNLHLIGEATGMADLQLMVQLTALQHSRLPSPLSPHLYWWDGQDSIQPITSFDGEDTHLVLPDELEHLLER